VKLSKSWNWVQPNGALRDMVFQGFMLALHRAGYIKPPRAKIHPTQFTGQAQKAC
jgi:hypothetical protein